MREDQDHTNTNDTQPALGRRDVVRRLLTAGLSFSVVPSLIACSSGSSGRRRFAKNDLIDPVWPSPRDLRLTEDHTVTPHYRPVKPSTPTTASGIDISIPEGVTARTSWAKGRPVPSLMDTMTPIHRITMHHDGMTVFTSIASSSAKARIEAIRSAHRGRGWGDIGYHYVIDPAGRVWEGRPLSWQGAHVKNQNPGNIGICMLGNYEDQRPNTQQLESLESFVSRLMRTHGVALREVYTHREFAPTACPGRYLQPRLVAMRENSGALARV